MSKVVVRQPGEGRAYWQPKPANGFAEVKVTPAATGHPGFSAGFQTVAPGGRVREHSHESQVELQVCFRGTGRIVVDGEIHALVPGTMAFLAPHAKHEIVNEGEDDLVMLWVISPPGLEDFFAAIGRERKLGEPAPAPFARPADVVAIERAMGMQDTQA